MKFILTIALSMFSQVYAASTAPFPGQWEKILRSSDCETNYSLWELNNSNVAVLEIKSLSFTSFRAMTLKVMNTERKIYETADGLLPSFEIALKEIYESSLPTLVISRSGVRSSCMMTHVIGEDNFSNVGSIGH